MRRATSGDEAIGSHRAGEPIIDTTREVVFAFAQAHPAEKTRLAKPARLNSKGNLQAVLLILNWDCIHRAALYKGSLLTT